MSNVEPVEFTDEFQPVRSTGALDGVSWLLVVATLIHFGIPALVQWWQSMWNGTN